MICAPLFCAAVLSQHQDVAGELMQYFGTVQEYFGDHDSTSRDPSPQERVEPAVSITGTIEEDEALVRELPGFKNLTLIGRGGMVQVYRAYQIDLDRDVAVKVRLGRLSKDKLRRFRQEQKVLANLHHTNIVPVHLSGEHQGLQYFAMALIEGMTLKDVVAALRDPRPVQGQTTTLANLAEETLKSRATRSLPAPSPVSSQAPPPAPPSRQAERRKLAPSLDYYRSVAKVLADAAYAVQHAHDSGVVHRDLKPGNIMVDRRGQCWIIDFGLASARDKEAAETPQESDRLTTPGAGRTHGAVGTYAYMAPEQHQGQPVKQSDVWGLGVTLYELLTLQPAFAGEDEGEVLARILKGSIVGPRKVDPGIPRDLEAICLKALRRDFADDLYRWLRG
jgi:serine/threonine protein kinase